MATVKSNSKSNIKSKPAASERIVHAMRASVSTDGNGITENVYRGWTLYDDPTLVAARAAGKERRDAESLAYFSKLYQS
jgi:hypothetical protein